MIKVTSLKLDGLFVLCWLFGLHAGCDQIFDFREQGLFGESVFWQPLLDIPIQCEALLRGHVLRGHYNDRNGSPLFVLMELGDKLITVHFRHHQIQEDQVGPLRRKPFQRSFSKICVSILRADSSSSTTKAKRGGGTLRNFARISVRRSRSTGLI